MFCTKNFCLNCHSCQEQKLNKVVMDPSSLRDYERPFKSLSKQQEQLEPNPSAHPNIPKSDDSFENNAESEELKKS